MIVLEILFFTLFIIKTTNSMQLFPKINVSSSRIIGGRPARVGEFPWQVNIETKTGNGHYYCGGSLISSQWIVTSADCLNMGRQFTITMGTTKLSGVNSNQVMATSNGIAHPGYNNEILDNNIGLIKLRIPITFNEYIKPVRLAKLDKILENTSVQVAGWGQINDSETGISDTLLCTNLTTISFQECQLTYGFSLKGNMICAAGNYNEGICIGDGGSPLVTKTGLSGETIQIGVSLFASQNGCESIDPSGFTRIDLYVPWIESVTGLKL